MALRRGKPPQRRTWMNRVSPGRCCDKKAFATKAAAEAALTRIASVATSADRPRSAYKCGNDWWHLTSQTPQRPDTGPSRKTRLIVLKRDRHQCAMCGVSIVGRYYSLQHRRARGDGGSSDPRINATSNLITLCGSATSPGGCHLYCEQRNADAMERGFVVSLNSDEDPADIRVDHALFGLVLLDDAGGWRPAPDHPGTDRLLADLRTAAAAEAPAATAETPNPRGGTEP